MFITHRSTSAARIPRNTNARLYVRETNKIEVHPLQRVPRNKPLSNSTGAWQFGQRIIATPLFPVCTWDRATSPVEPCQVKRVDWKLVNPTPGDDKDAK